MADLLSMSNSELEKFFVDNLSTIRLALTHAGSRTSTQINPP